nr:hypothetical protein [Bacteroidota bacterium]
MNPLIKTIFCLLIFILFFANAYSQDTLFKKDSTQLAVKVLQVSSKEIKYHVHGKVNPLIHSVKKNKVVAIKYKNGECDSFPQIDEPSQPLFKNMLPLDTIIHGHFVSVNIPSPIAPQITMNYEYKFKSGHFGLKIPVSIGFRLLKKNHDYFSNAYHDEHGDNFYYDPYKLISTELQLLYYPYARGGILGFVGPSVEIGKYDYFIFPDANPFNHYPEQIKQQTNYYCALLRVGLLIHKINHLFISFNGALGGGYSIEKYDYSNGQLLHEYKFEQFQMRLAVTIGYHLNN